MCVCPAAHVQAVQEKDRTEEEDGIRQPLPLPPICLPYLSLMCPHGGRGHGGHGGDVRHVLCLVILLHIFLYWVIYFLF